MIMRFGKSSFLYLLMMASANISAAQLCADTDGTFALANVAKSVGCEWLTKNKKRADKRLENYCPSIGASTCPKSCDMCPDINFNRVATFPICSQIDANCNTDEETVAEIVAASSDGMSLVYTDSEQENIGFVDITDPKNPIAAGVVKLGGEPTSVAVLGGYALAGVNNSTDYVNTSGQLVAIDMATQTIVKSWELGGQPDAVAVSPNGKYVAVAIENERDEDLGDGSPPQMPAGYVVLVDTAPSLDDWKTTTIALTGLSGVLFPEDPEPEFVAFSTNSEHLVVTLQENNAIVIIDPESKTVTRSFSAGSVDLTNIDTEEEGIIDQTSSLTAVPREPDGTVFLNSYYFATADEGDLNGGSRGFTVFDILGNVAYSSGSEMDQIAATVGHYPDERSGNKGVEPENVAFGIYEGNKYLFVNAERAGLVFVYDVADQTKPVLKQLLPTNVGPEGGLTIPGRNLFVVASEKDDRGDKIRSTLTIYERTVGAAEYPTLVSERDATTGVGIPFAAMSGLSGCEMPNILYSIEDSFYKSNRFFTIDSSKYPAVVTKASTIKDTTGVFAAVSPYGNFTAAELAAMINSDGTVNIDPEGIASDGAGNLYIASEGRGTVGDADRPIESLNFIFKVDMDGNILKVITLPDELNDIQLRFGLEGIAYDPAGYLVACLQRAWGDNKGALILKYNLATEMWNYFQYPLDTPTSQNGGWVGLSDISYVEKDIYFVLERDNQGGPDAAIKKIYAINLADYPLAEDGEMILKEEVIDLLPEVSTKIGGLALEKIEGMGFDGSSWFILNDNDGVDDNSGETRLINLGELEVPTIPKPCRDQSLFKFPLDLYPDKERDCGWITKNKNKMETRKEQYCDRFAAECAKTCGTCS